MTQLKTKNVVEMHGCIVCGKTFTILAAYTPGGKLVEYTLTSPGGHRVAGEQQPLVACDSHTAGEIEAAYQRWQSRNDLGPDDEPEDKMTAHDGL